MELTVKPLYIFMTPERESFSGNLQTKVLHQLQQALSVLKLKSEQETSTMFTLSYIKSFVYFIQHSDKLGHLDEWEQTLKWQEAAFDINTELKHCSVE